VSKITNFLEFGVVLIFIWWFLWNRWNTMIV